MRTSPKPVPVHDSFKLALRVFAKVNEIGVRMPSKHLYAQAYANLREQGMFIKVYAGHGTRPFGIHFCEHRTAGDLVVRYGMGFDEETGCATEDANEEFFTGTARIAKAAKRIVELIDNHYFTNTDRKVKPKAQKAA